jgi:hypothetical protein
MSKMTCEIAALGGGGAARAAPAASADGIGARCEEGGRDLTGGYPLVVGISSVYWSAVCSLLLRISS